MVAKAKAGELNLVRTIWGLRQAKAAKACAAKADGLRLRDDRGWDGLLATPGWGVAGPC